MNHNAMPGVHIRRVLHIPRVSAPSDMPSKKDPIVIRQTYDISTACTRRDSDDAPLTVHIRGERTMPLLRCVTVGAAVIGIAAAAGTLIRLRKDWQLRRKFARRYAERLQKQRLRMQIRHADAKNTAADSCPR